MPGRRRLVLLALLLFPAAGEAATIELRATVLGQQLLVELPAGATAEAAGRAAITAARDVERLVDPARGPLASLDAAAGAGPQAVPPELLGLLQRALEICRWSEGTYGPLAGRLHELWGLRRPNQHPPSTQDLQAAAAITGCDRLQLDPAAGTAALAAGARLDLWGFVQGAAVDAAIASLAAAGASAASVTLGPVQRAVGSPPDGATGWPLRVAMPEGFGGLTRRLELRDSAFAVAAPGLATFAAGDESWPPWLDHRTGRPGSGILAAAVVTARGVDAEALAATAFVAGNRRGAHLLAQLRPSPSALWLLGSGAGEPLVIDFRWGLVPRRSAAR